jgi:hypothetical protein
MSRFIVLTIALFALIAAPAVGASGAITGADAGFNGVTTRGVGARYLAQHVKGGTLLMAVDRRGGRILQSRFVREPLIVSAVDFAGTGAGLSASGGALVLSSPRTTYPRRRSDFAVFETEQLRRIGSFSLRGDFSLDAISPDGNRLYFIELTGRDSTHYRVREYDRDTGRLLPKPVVDPAEADEPMRGSPISRAMSEDGRWAYTLYDGNGTHPFIHALDTARGRAKCIDLDALAGRQDLMDLRVTVARGGSIVVGDGSGPVLAVDPTSFAVHAPRPTAPAPPPPAASGGGIGWLGPVAGAALLALLAAFALRAGNRWPRQPRMR